MGSRRPVDPYVLGELRLPLGAYVWEQQAKRMELHHVAVSPIKRLAARTDEPHALDTRRRARSLRGL